MVSRDFISPEFDWSKEEYDNLLNLAYSFKEKVARKQDISKTLKNKTLFMLFYAASLRTRTGFEAAMTDLGGHAQMITPESIFTQEGVQDIARVLSTYGHGIAIRVWGKMFNFYYGKGNALLRDFAKWADIPVISMEDDMFHPHEALEELMTIKDKFKKLKGLKVVYSWAYAPSPWKPVSVPQSLITIWTKYGMDVTLVHPRGLELDSNIIEKCKKNASESGGNFSITNDMKEALKGANVVHAKNYMVLKMAPPNTNNYDENAAREFCAKYKDWTLDQKNFDLLDSKRLYLHCLPADRGFEVANDVIDGPDSGVWLNQKNRPYAKKAILTSVMK
jgi:N-acetylornithine carbamoyltransferase